ncbi:hypothetical protein FQN52_003443 [Onygenales sp. PD_12]|nr:hypothetical protein FQN52_003443 [Onygenales sp. PD_12]
MDPTLRKIRHALFTFYLEHCRPPTVDELANASDKPRAEIEGALAKLQELHHIVLYGEGVCSATPIEMAHPFSHLPTPFIVTHGARSWWANCAWCSFGLAAMLQNPLTITTNDDEPITITTRSGSIGPELVFEIGPGDQITCNGSAETAAKCRVHFSVPPSKWWDNVRFACGTIQLLASEGEAEEWAGKYGFWKGEVMDVSTLWGLSKVWYHDKHTYGYERKTPKEAFAIFDKLGLTSTYWSS